MNIYSCNVGTSITLDDQDRDGMRYYDNQGEFILTIPNTLVFEFESAVLMWLMSCYPNNTCLKDLWLCRSQE